MKPFWIFQLKLLLNLLKNLLLSLLLQLICLLSSLSLYKFLKLQCVKVFIVKKPGHVYKLCFLRKRCERSAYCNPQHLIQPSVTASLPSKERDDFRTRSYAPSCSFNLTLWLRLQSLWCVHLNFAFFMVILVIPLRNVLQFRNFEESIP